MSDKHTTTLPSIDDCIKAINNIRSENDTILLQPDMCDIMVAFSFLDEFPELKICLISENDYVSFYLYQHTDKNYYKIRRVNDSIEAFNITKEAFTTPERPTCIRQSVLNPPRYRNTRKLDFNDDFPPRTLTHPELISPITVPDNNVDALTLPMIIQTRPLTVPMSASSLLGKRKAEPSIEDCLNAINLYHENPFGALLPQARTETINNTMTLLEKHPEMQICWMASGYSGGWSIYAFRTMDGDFYQITCSNMEISAVPLEDMRNI